MFEAFLVLALDLLTAYSRWQARNLDMLKLIALAKGMAKDNFT